MCSHNVTRPFSVPTCLFCCFYLLCPPFFSCFVSVSLFFCLSAIQLNSVLNTPLNTHIHTHTHAPSESLRCRYTKILHRQQKQPLLEMTEDVYILKVFSDSWGTSNKCLSPLDKVGSASLSINDAHYLPLCPQLFGNSRALSWGLDALKWQQRKLSITALPYSEVKGDLIYFRSGAMKTHIWASEWWCLGRAEVKRASGNITAEDTYSTWATPNTLLPFFVLSFSYFGCSRSVSLIFLFLNNWRWCWCFVFWWLCQLCWLTHLQFLSNHQQASVNRLQQSDQTSHIISLLVSWIPYNLT